MQEGAVQNSAFETTNQYLAVSCTGLAHRVQFELSSQELHAASHNADGIF